MRCVICMACVAILTLQGCQPHGITAAKEYVLYGGMERDDVWTVTGCAMTGGVLRLKSSETIPFAMISQLLPPFSGEEKLLLTVRARSRDATASLEVDLYGFGFDDPAQQMSVPPESLNGTFRSFSAIIPARAPDRGLWLRVFTESRTGIEVDAVSVQALPATGNK